MPAQATARDAANAGDAPLRELMGAIAAGDGAAAERWLTFVEMLCVLATNRLWIAVAKREQTMNFFVARDW